MKYEKPALSFEQQADKLIDRGLIADKETLVRRLEVTNYFRLSGYLHPFRDHGTDRYLEGTTLDEVWRRYLFDQGLRTLILDAIEAIEVFVRTQLAYQFSLQYGAFQYRDPSYFPKLDPNAFAKWDEKLMGQVKRSKKSKEEFLIHFFNRYGDKHTHPPIWTLVELMDLGSTLTFYRGVNDSLKQDLIRKVAVPEPVLTSWLIGLNTVRNRCAHHLRLWNWTLGTHVKIPNERKYPHWHHGSIPNDRMGIVIMLCRHLLKQISPSSLWHTRMENHFEEYPEIPVGSMGLPNDWKDHPLWKK